MEKGERDTINDNLPQLIELTDCNSCFLAKFVPGKILTITDVETLLNSTPGDKSDRVFKFYQLIMTRVDAYRLLLGALRETGQSGALQILQPGSPQGSMSSDGEMAAYNRNIELVIRKTLPRTASVIAGDEIRVSPSVSFGVRAPSPQFTGREEELKSLHEIISSAQGNTTVISQITSVCGLGGIGKTQLARRYVQQYGSYFDHNVVWIDAESKETLSLSFRQFASDVLTISTTNADNKDRDVSLIVHDCYQHFSNSKAIFVFDNAEKEDYLKPFLPVNNVNISVLITSREREWGTEVKRLDLNLLNELDAISFVKKGLNIDIADYVGHVAEIKSLIETLQCFPLALQQAISYINNEDVTGVFTISQYLGELKSKKCELLNINISDSLYDDYTKTTFNTWLMTRDKIASNADCGSVALELLELIAYFGPEKIPRETFNHLNACSEGKIKKAIRLLTKYSLVDGYKRQSLLSIHRLVQKVVRLWIAGANKRLVVLEKALKMFEVHLDEGNVSHAMWVFWKYARKSKELVINYQKLPGMVIRKVRDLRLLEEGIKFGTDVMPILQNMPEISPNNLIDFEENVGETFRLNNNFPVALNLLRLVYDKKKKMYGSRSEQTFWTKQKIGLTLFNRGSYMEGFKLCNSASEGLARILGDSDRSALAALSRTTEMACKVGEFQIAVTRIIKVHKCQHKAFGDQDVDVYFTRMRLGLIKSDMGSIEGLELLQEIYKELDSMTERTGDMEELCQLVLIKVCDQLYRFGFYVEGLEKSRHLYAIRKKRFGKNHIYTINSLDLVGMCLLGLGRIDEAYSVLARIYIKLKERWGTYHNYTLRILSNVGLALSRQGNHDQALAAYFEVFEGLKNNIDGDCIDMLEIKLNYAEILENSGYHEEALKVLEEVREVHSRKFGEEQVLYKHCIKCIAHIQQNGCSLQLDSGSKRRNSLDKVLSPAGSSKRFRKPKK